MVERADVTSNSARLNPSPIPIFRLFIREKAVTGTVNKSTRNKKRTSLTLRTCFHFLFTRSRRTAKFVVPINIWMIVISSMVRLLYSPILFNLVEKPPVDKEHMV